MHVHEKYNCMCAANLNLLPHTATGPETHALGDRSAYMCAVNPGYNLKEKQGRESLCFPLCLKGF